MWVSSWRKPTRKVISATRKSKNSNKTNELGPSIVSKYDMDKTVNGASIETPFFIFAIVKNTDCFLDIV